MFCRVWLCILGQPIPVVAAIVELNGSLVVLVRNKGWPEKFFGLVSGFLEQAETPESATLREVKEELGLDGTMVRFIGCYPFFEMNQLILAFHVKAQGEAVMGGELAEIKFISPGKLRSWPFGAGLAVRDWLEKRNRYERTLSESTPRGALSVMETESLLIDAQPPLKDVEFLENQINDFNFENTSIYDGTLLAIFVRNTRNEIVAGIYGWS